MWMDAYFGLSAYGSYTPKDTRCQSIFSYSIHAHGCLFLLVRIVLTEWSVNFFLFNSCEWMLILACQPMGPTPPKTLDVSPFFPIQFMPMDAYFCLSVLDWWRLTCQSIFSYSICDHGCIFLLIRLVKPKVLVHFFPIQFVTMDAYVCLSGCNNPRC